jgi:hypothetical protein
MSSSVFHYCELNAGIVDLEEFKSTRITVNDKGECRLEVVYCHSDSGDENIQYLEYDSKKDAREDQSVLFEALDDYYKELIKNRAVQK